jgi:hypothetical protein
MQLELESGGHAIVDLPAPGDFSSFYVFSMEYSGNVRFWQVLSELMSAAGRPLFALHEALRSQSVHLGKLARSAIEEVLAARGLGLGIFFAVDPVLEELMGGRTKLLFLRDPRDVLRACYRDSAYRAATDPTAPGSFAEFLGSQQVAMVMRRYRRYAQLRRQDQSVLLLRYEQSLRGWHEAVSEIVAKLDLPVDPIAAAAIAAAAAPVGEGIPGDAGHEANDTDGVTRADISRMDDDFADVLAALGYARRSPSQGAPQSSRPLTNSISNQPGTDKVSLPQEPRVGRLAAIFEHDPVLLHRLRPNSAGEMHVLGRRVVMDVDASGCRPVVGQPADTEITLAAYGCSFTYGIAVAAQETFCSQLQGMFPAWRVENHGVSGYSATRNLLQLERNARWNRAQFVTFCWIPQHLRRNVAAASWIQVTSESYPRGRDRQGPADRIVRAAIDSDGRLEMRTVRVPRHDLLGIDLADFEPDQYYLDLVGLRLFERAHALVTGYGGHFFITTLQGRFSGTLLDNLADRGIPVVDASLEGNEYLCVPDDPHANARAHRIYAERIRDYLMQYKGR